MTQDEPMGQMSESDILVAVTARLRGTLVQVTVSEDKKKMWLQVWNNSVLMATYTYTITQNINNRKHILKKAREYAVSLIRDGGMIIDEVIE